MHGEPDAKGPTDPPDRRIASAADRAGEEMRMNGCALMRRFMGDSLMTARGRLALVPATVSLVGGTLAWLLY